MQMIQWANFLGHYLYHGLGDWGMEALGVPRTSRSVSLVVGFWAEADSLPKKEHRLEVEAAILQNLDNPYFDQVVVLLDSITPQANCLHFLQRMEPLRHTSMNGEKRPSFTCIDREAGQPNYLEMFQFTLTDVVQGDIVVMSNGDQVFDESIALAKRVRPNTLLVLSTLGYNATLVPQAIRKYYPKELTDKETNSTMDPVAPNYCRPFFYKNNTENSGQKIHYSWSWDTYIYDKDTLIQAFVASGVPLHTSPSVTLSSPKSSPFKRRQRIHPDQEANPPPARYLPYFMNEMGSENAALYDMTSYWTHPPTLLLSSSKEASVHQPKSIAPPESTGSPPLPLVVNLTLWNPCHLIRTWHFHLAPKTHRQRRWQKHDRMIRFPPLCHSREECANAFYG